MYAMRVALLSGLLLAAASGRALADTPAPTRAVSTPPAPDTSGTGPVHKIEVRERGGARAAPAGTTVDLARVLPPTQAGPVEQRTIRCAQVAVVMGVANLTPVLSSDCPADSNIVAIIFYPDGQPGVVAQPQPAIAWRRAIPGEPVREISLVVTPPQTGEGLPAGAAAPPQPEDSTSTSGAGLQTDVALVGLATLVLAAGVMVAARRRGIQRLRPPVSARSR